MTSMHRVLEKIIGLLALATVSYFPGPHQVGRSTPRLIALVADHDSRYKIAGMKQPEIAVKAGEPFILRITANKAKNRNREGAVHGFTLLHAKDRKPVPDWDFQLQPGTQDISVIAPTEVGEYVVICTVICSEDHEGMNMKFVVLP
jgi:hypothetical protein